MQANPERGEAPLIVVREGVEHEYVLMLATGPTRSLERRRQQTLGELIDEVDKLKVVSIVDVLHMMLQKHHAKEFSTTESVDNLIDEYGGPLKAYRAIVEVLKLNNPEGTANPLKAPSSTGDASISTPAA